MLNIAYQLRTDCYPLCLDTEFRTQPQAEAHNSKPRITITSWNAEDISGPTIARRFDWARGGTCGMLSPVRDDAQ